MLTIYVDETGFTGEDLLSQDQPIFVLSTNNFTSHEAEAIIDAIFSGVSTKELKHSRMIRSPRHRDRIIELVRCIATDYPTRAGNWVAHKEFALVTFVVEWWIEPLCHRYGFNLYKDGANFAMENMLFVCLEGFWSERFRRALLSCFQRMFRARTRLSFAEAETFIRKHVDKAEGKGGNHQNNVLRLLLLPFSVLGCAHLIRLPDHVLDLALPGLVVVGNSWRARLNGLFEIVHDQSSNMARQKWMWDILTSPEMPAAQFPHPGGGVQAFPMNVTATRFGDSRHKKQLQLCDILAGTTSAYLRSISFQGEGKAYCDRLAEAGIDKLILGSIWPSTKVTAEELGTAGWDGNHAIEWIANQFRLALRR